MTKQGCCFERPNFIMANRKSKKRMANNHRSRMVIVETGSSHWISGTRLVSVGLVVTGAGLVSAGAGQVVADICWCRKVIAGAGLVVAGICWCRKVVAGSRLAAAGAELVIAAAGRSPVQDW